MNWYIKCIKDNYANFNGRARREEYWMFILINIIIFMFLNLLTEISGINMTFFIILYCCAYCALFIPSLAVSVRRFHDIGKSGFNTLWLFIPIIGNILVLYWFCKSGDKGINKYGPDPKSLDSENEILEKI